MRPICHRVCLSVGAFVKLFLTPTIVGNLSLSLSLPLWRATDRPSKLCGSKQMREREKIKTSHKQPSPQTDTKNHNKRIYYSLFLFVQWPFNLFSSLYLWYRVFPPTRLIFPISDRSIITLLIIFANRLIIHIVLVEWNLEEKER